MGQECEGVPIGVGTYLAGARQGVPWETNSIGPHHPITCPYPRPEKLSILAQPPSSGVRVVLMAMAFAPGLAGSPAKVSEALDAMLIPAGLSYEVRDGKIVLKKQ